MTISEKFRYKNLAVVPVFSTWAVRAKISQKIRKISTLFYDIVIFHLLWPPPSPNPLQGVADALHRGRYFDVEPSSSLCVKLISLWKPGHCFFVGKSINIQVDQRRHLLCKNICHSKWAAWIVKVAIVEIKAKRVDSILILDVEILD